MEWLQRPDRQRQPKSSRQISTAFDHAELLEDHHQAAVKFCDLLLNKRNACSRIKCSNHIFSNISIVHSCAEKMAAYSLRVFEALTALFLKSTFWYLRYTVLAGNPSFERRFSAGNKGRKLNRN